MPYLKRDENNRIVAFSVTEEAGFNEYLEDNSSELQAFLQQQMVTPQQNSALQASDQSIIRVLEDLIMLLSDKGVIQFTELPDEAQNKLMRRLSMRRAINDLSDLAWSDDETVDIKTSD
ncbi:hypothetical protein [Idiomarina aminovorans]|uniref:hypothetical protein n=1 Tax=Idiomarina aminovorans TaxID=2914829 RepID=UPI002002A9B2|nr:hypothetical protein [Idiomarina sp. ATCH4]MCK7460342.1 hypothetical protein [Idiomarina sp. ATCH4]